MRLLRGYLYRLSDTNDHFPELRRVGEQEVICKICAIQDSLTIDVREGKTLIMSIAGEKVKLRFLDTVGRFQVIVWDDKKTLFCLYCKRSEVEERELNMRTRRNSLSKVLISRERRPQEKSSIALHTSSAGRRMTMALGAMHQLAFVAEDGSVTVIPVAKERSHAPEPIQLRRFSESCANPISPYSLLPVQRDTRLFMLDRNKRDIVHGLDFGKGQMAFEISHPELLANLVGLSASTKSSQLNSVSEFLAFTRNQLHMVDTRHPGYVVRSTCQRIRHGRLKSGNVQVVTSGDGKIFVGAEDGALRVYDKISNNKRCLMSAKSQYSNTSPVDLDVTHNGAFVLITQSNILEIMGMKKLYTRKLLLDPGDIVIYGLHGENFTSGKFVQGHGATDYIIATIGRCVAIWKITLWSDEIMEIGPYYMIGNGSYALPAFTTVAWYRRYQDIAYVGLSPPYLVRGCLSLVPETPDLKQ